MPEDAHTTSQTAPKKQGARARRRAKKAWALDCGTKAPLDEATLQGLHFAKQIMKEKCPQAGAYFDAVYAMIAREGGRASHLEVPPRPKTLPIARPSEWTEDAQPAG